MTVFRYGAGHRCGGLAPLAIVTAMLLGLLAPASPKTWDRVAAQKAFDEATRLHSQLRESSSSTASKKEYLHCIRMYQRVYLKDPHYGGSDDAAYEAGKLYQEMGNRFGGKEYYTEAVKLFKLLVSGYPRSKYRPDGLLRIGSLYFGPLENNTLAMKAYEELQEKYKSSDAAKTASKNNASRRVTESPSPNTPAAGDAPAEQSVPHVQSIRHWSTSDYTRVVIDLDGDAPYQKTRLSDPDRIFFDIQGAKLSPDLVNKTFVVGDEFLKQVRVGQNRLDVVRVVLDFASIRDYSVFELHDPFRIIIDINGPRAASLKEPRNAKDLQPRADEIAEAQKMTSRTQAVEASPKRGEETKAAPKSATADQPTTRPGRQPITVNEIDPPPPPPTRGEKKDAAASSPATPPKTTPAKQRGERALTPPAATPGTNIDPTGTKTEKKEVAANAPETAGPSPSKAREASGPARSDAGTKLGTRSIPSPKAAPPTSRGDRTITRILGLKIGRIVLDPGHGGHDSGTTGPDGLKEKDLVLAVAHQLQALLEDRLAADVVLTRNDDTFIPLEERTAIANQHQADLFVSIHANSSRAKSATGVETYYLNFASSDAERDVAARENASTIRNIRDLEDLVRKIAQADKSAESREFASIVQKKLYQGTNKLYATPKNRGVRSAPFVVLIGANMPSVLAEVGFISNPRDEKLLKREQNKQRLAEALYSGIEGYIKTLGISVAQNPSHP